MSGPGEFREAALPLVGGQANQPVRGPGKQPSYIEGHRERLRKRFMEGGADALPDYELLELLLFRTFRRGDVKPVAHRLLNTFGDFNRVISAPVDQLLKVPGVGTATITDFKIVEAAAQRHARAKLLNRRMN